MLLKNIGIIFVGVMFIWLFLSVIRSFIPWIHKYSVCVRYLTKFLTKQMFKETCTVKHFADVADVSHFL